jgi:hypothetical protein
MTGSDMVSQMVNLFDDLGRDIAGNGCAPDDTLHLITKRAVDHVPGATDAGITRARDGNGFESVGTTSELVRDVDEVQYEIGSGPCVDAALDAAVYCTGDLRNDSRWPQFGKRAADDYGVQSMLSFRMFFEDDEYIAALNLYSPQRDAFDEQSCLTGLALSTFGAIAVTSARRQERVVNLERALESNRDIGVAIGVLMALHKVTREQAFDLLRMASQAKHRKVRDLAHDVAETGTLDFT